MNIGKEEPAIVVEPLEVPSQEPSEVPAEAPAAPEKVKVPEKVGV